MFIGKLKFKLLAKKQKARVGEIEFNGVKFRTPVFMLVGTKATIKGIILDLLKDTKCLLIKERIKLILANAYYLFLSPIDETCNHYICKNYSRACLHYLVKILSICQ